jgi:hypothetical protein
MVYVASKEQLDELVEENMENLTMSWTCRDISKGDKKDVQVIGPIEEVSEEVVSFKLVGLLDRRMKSRIHRKLAQVEDSEICETAPLRRI